MHWIIWKYKFDFKCTEKTSKTNLVLLFFPFSVFNNLFFKLHRYWLTSLMNLPAFTMETRKMLFLMHSLFYSKANRPIPFFPWCWGVHDIQCMSCSVDFKWNHDVLTDSTGFCFVPFDVQWNNEITKVGKNLLKSLSPSINLTLH